MSFREVFPYAEVVGHLPPDVAESLVMLQDEFEPYSSEFNKAFEEIERSEAEKNDLKEKNHKEQYPSH